MYYLHGGDAVVRNAAVLSYAYLTNSPATSRDQLRVAYLRYLRSLSVSSEYTDYLDGRIIRDESATAPQMVFSGSDPEITVLGAIFGNPSPDGDARMGDAPPWRLAKCRSGAEFLAQRDSALAAIMSLLTHTVFSVSTSWTGSMSDRQAIGVTLLIPGEHWLDNDVAEALIHEFTHTALFLDERVHGHFRAGADRIVLKSAIRKDERTLPAVVHSLLVAAEVLSWRRAQDLWDGIRFRLHGDSQRMLDTASESYRTLVELDSWQAAVDERMAELVAAAGDRLESLSREATPVR